MQNRCIFMSVLSLLEPTCCSSIELSFWSSRRSGRSFLKQVLLSFSSLIAVFRSAADKTDSEMVDLMCQEDFTTAFLSSFGLLARMMGRKLILGEIDLNILQHFRVLTLTGS